jgi:hypothetical protein
MDAPALDGQTPTVVIGRHPEHGFVITGAIGADITDITDALSRFGYRAAGHGVLVLPAGMDEHAARFRLGWAAQLLAGAGRNVVIQADSQDIALSSDATASDPDSTAGSDTDDARQATSTQNRINVMRE